MHGDIHQTMTAISVIALPVLIAITTHEASHGFVAHRCGDDTAYRMGRVTFNPLKHIDPFGTILLPLMMFFTVGFLFGYAKPVPINPRQFRSFRRDLVLVAAAGPGSNLVLAFVSALLLHLMPFTPAWFSTWAVQVLLTSIAINVVPTGRLMKGSDSDAIYCIPSVAPATGGIPGPTGGTAFSIFRFSRSSAR